MVASWPCFSLVFPPLPIWKIISNSWHPWVQYSTRPNNARKRQRRYVVSALACRFQNSLLLGQSIPASKPGNLTAVASMFQLDLHHRNFTDCTFASREDSTEDEIPPWLSEFLEIELCWIWIPLTLTVSLHKNLH